MARNNVSEVCRLCGKKLSEGEEVMIFAPATLHKNVWSRMYPLPDGKLRVSFTHKGLEAAHTKCFQEFLYVP